MPSQQELAKCMLLSQGHIPLSSCVADADVGVFQVWVPASARHPVRWLLQSLWEKVPGTAGSGTRHINHHGESLTAATAVLTQLLLSCCLTSTEVRWPIRDGDRVGRGRESERLDRRNCPKKTGETVDRCQNNGSVKAVSPRHCPATCALCNCSFNCCAGQSH